MLKIFVLLLSIFIVGCASSTKNPTPIDQIPMYGGLHRPSDPTLKAADETFIQGMTEAHGDIETASDRMVDHAFHYYYADDLSKAMQRFNQAWLLNQRNPDVFHGFASVLNDWGQFCEASKMMEKSFVLGLERKARNLADTGRVFALCSASDTLTNNELSVQQPSQPLVTNMSQS